MASQEVDTYGLLTPKLNPHILFRGIIGILTDPSHTDTTFLHEGKQEKRRKITGKEKCIGREYYETVSTNFSSSSTTNKAKITTSFTSSTSNATPYLGLYHYNCLHAKQS